MPNLLAPAVGPPGRVATGHPWAMTDLLGMVLVELHRRPALRAFALGSPTGTPLSGVASDPTSPWERPAAKNDGRTALARPGRVRPVVSRQVLAALVG
jgi:hypothetical protein